MSRELFRGFGVIDDKVSYVHNGISKPCLFYQAWSSMIIRCYAEDRREAYRTYIGCTVDERWRKLSEFKKWMQSKDWKGKCLDKDLLVKGNRIYSPETCAMLSNDLNSFIMRHGHPDLLEGVIYNSSRKEYVPIRYRYPFIKEIRRQPRAAFKTEEEAHIQHLENRHEIALLYAENEKDPAVAEALRNRWRTK